MAWRYYVSKSLLKVILTVNWIFKLTSIYPGVEQQKIYVHNILRENLIKIAKFMKN